MCEIGGLRSAKWRTRANPIPRFAPVTRTLANSHGGLSICCVLKLSWWYWSVVRSVDHWSIKSGAILSNWLLPNPREMFTKMKKYSCTFKLLHLIYSYDIFVFLILVVGMLTICILKAHLTARERCTTVRTPCVQCTVHIIRNRVGDVLSSC